MTRTVPKKFISFHEADVIRVKAHSIMVAQGLSLETFVDLGLCTTLQVSFRRTTESTPKTFGTGDDAFAARESFDRYRPENITFDVPVDNPMWQQYGAYFEFLKDSGVARVLVKGSDLKTEEPVYLELYHVKLHAPQNGTVTGQLFPMTGQPKCDALGEYGFCECESLSFTPAELVRREANSF
jgi:hypothetical protein